MCILSNKFISRLFKFGSQRTYSFVAALCPRLHFLASRRLLLTTVSRFDLGRISFFFFFLRGAGYYTNYVTHAKINHFCTKAFGSNRAEKDLDSFVGQNKFSVKEWVKFVISRLITSNGL